jgi:flavin-dependent dehydrogenase
VSGNPHPRYDVCVVGGGPAGGVAAWQLAKLGLSTCVIDRAAAAAGHVGVSLPPSARSILASIGLAVDDAVLLECSGAVVRWGHEQHPAYRHYPEAGLTVDRPRFDALLLSAARAAGAHVVTPAVAARPVLHDDGMWRVAVRHDGRHDVVCARYLVDAAGRHGILRGGRRPQPNRTFAIHATWTGVFADGNETRVEAAPEGWAWAAPLGRTEFLAAVFVDESTIARNGRARIAETYRRHLADSELLRPCVGGQLRSAVMVCEASPAHPTNVCGPGYIKVGDAAFCLDPLSSQGVQRAIVSALQAAAVVNTTLRASGNAHLARCFYQQRLAEAAGQDRAASGAFYREQFAVTPTQFWSSRLGPAQPSGPRPAPMDLPPMPHALSLSRDARQGTIGALVDGLIVPQPALFHPNLAGPVAFLGDWPIDRILAPVRGGISPAELQHAWNALLPRAAAADILSWLLWHRIVVAAAGANSSVIQPEPRDSARSSNARSVPPAPTIPRPTGSPLLD